MLALEDREIDETGKYGGKRSARKPVIVPPPASKLEGERGEALVRWVRQGDGKIQFVAINGQPLGDESEAVVAEETEPVEVVEESVEVAPEYSGESMPA